MSKKHSCPNYCDGGRPIMEFSEEKGCWVCPNCNLLAVFNALSVPYTIDSKDIEDR